MKSYPENINGHYTVKYIHKIKVDDEFLMNPNMHNFEKIKKGQVIAHNKMKPIKAPFDGYLLMPLYQSKGTEGFYLIN